MARLAYWIALASLAATLSAQTNNSSLAIHAQAAREAEERNDFPKAVAEYSYIARILPQNAEMLSNLGVALYFNREYEHALGVFKKATLLEPTMFTPHLFMGLTWSQLSNSDRAVPELRKAIQIRSSDPLAHTWLGYAYVAQHNYGDAVKEFEYASRLDPQNVDVWYALGQSYLQIGDDATAQLLVVAPAGARTWELAAEQHLLRNESAEALVDFEKANALRPDILDVRSTILSMGGHVADSTSPETKGNAHEDAIYQEAQDAEQKAKRAFQHVFDLAPDSYRAHQILADSYMASGRSEDAITEYRAVIAAKPDLPGIHQTLGNLLLNSGKLTPALEEFQEEVHFHPDSAEANMNVGRALLLMGRDEEAIETLNHTLQLDRPPLETWLLLGKLYVRKRQPLKAITMLKHFIENDQQTSTAYFLIASAYRQTGDKVALNDALTNYKRTSVDLKQRQLAQRELQMHGQSANEDKAVLDGVAQPEQ